jgi:hypothetical protein
MNTSAKPAVGPPGFLARLRAIVGDAHVYTNEHARLAYECDALAHARETPGAVVLPGSAPEVQQVVAACAEAGVPFVPRGHGTGLSGGALPVAGGIVLVLSRLNRILHVDLPNQLITVEPGVTNLAITKHVAPFGYYYAPDPSSQQVCSIGGNVAENSGGAHCLKYGFTVHHVVAVEQCCPTGGWSKSEATSRMNRGLVCSPFSLVPKAHSPLSPASPFDCCGGRRPSERCSRHSTAWMRVGVPSPTSSPRASCPLPSR